MSEETEIKEEKEMVKCGLCDEQAMKDEMDEVLLGHYHEAAIKFLACPRCQKVCERAGFYFSEGCKRAEMALREIKERRIILSS